MATTALECAGGAAGGEPSWLLPNAAWQLVSRHLPPEDLLAARAVCAAWARDLGAFVAAATAVPTQLLPRHSSDGTFGWSLRAAHAALQAAVTAYQEAPAQPAAAAALAAAKQALQAELEEAGCAPYAATVAGDADADGRRRAQRDGVSALLGAFPHCECVYVDVSSSAERALAAAVVGELAGEGEAGEAPGAKQPGGTPGSGNGTGGGAIGSSGGAVGSSSSGGGDGAAAAWAATAHADRHLPAGGGGGAPAATAARPRVCLDALRRSFHCHSRQDFPACLPGANAELFNLLRELPGQLGPLGLACLRSLVLDLFPPCAGDWQVLAGLPGLTELVLPGFRPALPYEHLPALAGLTQLESLTLSVQGSFTAWRANCRAFASLHQLGRLTSLSLHAFHCPGGHLADALTRLTRLEALRLSGRVVLDPLWGLSQLTRLSVLELTQDVQLAPLCDLVSALGALTQLAVGRVTLPPAPPASPPPLLAPAPAFPGNVWHPGPWPQPAAGAALVAGPAPAAAAAAAVAAAAGAAAAGAGAAAAAAAAAAAGGGGGGGGGGEVMLEDVGAIVDGLVGNLQDGAVPAHLQRIIERFESIIQLDLTRRVATSPWGWPLAGLGGSQWHCGGGAEGGGSSCFGSMELALLRPADVVRLVELPRQLRRCRHLGLRLRDQLLAFASVCPVRLAPGQLAHLGSAFSELASLSLCGKVALDGPALRELTQGLQHRGPAPGTPPRGAGSSSVARGCGGPEALGGAAWAPGGASVAPPRRAAARLLSLCLDCHFVAVSPDHMAAALGELRALQVLSLRHRGAGKLPIPLSALPPSLATLAVKKVLLFHHPRADARAATVVAGSGGDGWGGSCRQQVLAPSPVHCHALTSPGFRRAAASGALSAAPSFSAADLAQLAPPPGGDDDGGSDGSGAGSGAGGGGGTSGGLVSMGDGNGGAEPHVPAPLLPELQSLFLKNCLVAGEALGALLCSHQLTRLSVTGDNAAPGEVAEGWASWLEAVGQLKALQVLDLTVPECAGSLPPELCTTLQLLPRLAHLHLTTGRQPEQLLGLTSLAGLRTLGINYTGPPALPAELLGRLQSGLGPSCRVQLWELMAMQHQDSFGGAGPAEGGGQGVGGAANGPRRGRPRGQGGWLPALAWGALVAGGCCSGWLLGAAMAARRHPPPTARTGAVLGRQLEERGEGRGM